MEWHDLLTALCLVLILEGLMPFLNPNAWKSTLASLLKIDDRTIRSVALVAMLMGLFGLFLVRS